MDDIQSGEEDLDRHSDGGSIDVDLDRLAISEGVAGK